MNIRNNLHIELMKIRQRALRENKAPSLKAKMASDQETYPMKIQSYQTNSKLMVQQER